MREQWGETPFWSCLKVTPSHTTVTSIFIEFQPCTFIPVLVLTSTLGFKALLSNTLFNLLLCLASNSTPLTFVSTFNCVVFLTCWESIQIFKLWIFNWWKKGQIFKYYNIKIELRKMNWELKSPSHQTVLP